MVKAKTIFGKSIRYNNIIKKKKENSDMEDDIDVMETLRDMFPDDYTDEDIEEAIWGD